MFLVYLHKAIMSKSENEAKIASQEDDDEPDEW